MVKFNTAVFWTTTSFWNKGFNGVQIALASRSHPHLPQLRPIRG